MCDVCVYCEADATCMLSSLMLCFVTMKHTLLLFSDTYKKCFHILSAVIFSRPYDGRAIGTMLRLSVCRLSVTLCIAAKRCVLEQKLLLKAYRKSYMRNRLVPK